MSPDRFVREFALRRPPLWSGSLTLLTTMAVGSLLHLLARASLGIDPTALLFAVALLSLGLLSLLRRLLGRLRPVPTIQFFPNHVVLPRHVRAWRSCRIAYADVLALHLLGTGSMLHLLIEARGRLVHLPQASFVEGRALGRLVSELRRRIAALPQGDALMVQTAAQRQVVVKSLHRGTWTVQATAGLIGVFFANTALQGALQQPLGLLRWGANLPLRVAEGELFRLVSANFLHLAGSSSWLSGLQAFLTALAILHVGSLVERLLGWERTVVVLAAGGLACNLWLLTEAGVAFSYGGAGMLFGLLGAFAAVGMRLTTQLPLGLRQPRRWWATVALFCALLLLMWPASELRAHACSFVVGGLLTLATFGRRAELPRPATWPLRGLAMAFLLATGLSLGLAVRLASTAPPTYERDLLAAAPQGRLCDDHCVNALALRWGSHPLTPQDALPVAATAMAQVLQRAPQEASFYATQALILARQGATAQATVAAQQAVACSPELDPFYVGRLALLLEAQAPPVPPGAQIVLQPEAAQLLLQPPPSGPLATEPSNWCALLYRGETRLAALYARLPPRAGRTPLHNAWLRLLLSLLPEEPGQALRVRLLSVESAGVGARAVEPQWVLAPLVAGGEA